MGRQIHTFSDQNIGLFCNSKKSRQKKEILKFLKPTPRLAGYNSAKSYIHVSEQMKKYGNLICGGVK